MTKPAKSFTDTEALAIARCGSEQALADQLSKPATPAEVRAITDDRWLSDFSKSVFQAGFSWKVVEDKWPAFERVFLQFDLPGCAAMSDEALENTLKEEGIIRNRMKIKTIRDNARMLQDLSQHYGNLGTFFSDWQSTEYCDNVHQLAASGARLGGKTAQLTLRRLGVDSLIYTNDVIAALKREGVINSAPTSAKARTALQQTLNQWMAESGRSLNEISKILALSAG